MTEYNIDRLKEEVPAELTACQKAAKAILLATSAEFLVWRFRKAPEALRLLCSYNGGDEDWLVLTTEGAATDGSSGWCHVRWIEEMDTCAEPDVYELGGGMLVFVGSHA